MQNPADNLSLNRIINEPKRGIGKTSLDKIAQIAEQNNISMYEVIKHAENYGLNRVYLNSREFIDCIESIIAKKDELTISELVKKILKDMDAAMKNALENEKSELGKKILNQLQDNLKIAGKDNKNSI